MAVPFGVTNTLTMTHKDACGSLGQRTLLLSKINTILVSISFANEVPSVDVDEEPGGTGTGLTRPRLGLSF